MSTDGLFDLPYGFTEPAPTPELTRGQKRRRTVERRIAAGIHPLSYGGLHLPLHPDAATFTPGTARECITDGLRCGNCRYRVTERHHNKTYPKCHIGDGHPRSTGCESSDVRAWWPACRDYQPKADES